MLLVHLMLLLAPSSSRMGLLLGDEQVLELAEDALALILEVVGFTFMFSLLVVDLESLRVGVVGLLLLLGLVLALGTLKLLVDEWVHLRVLLQLLDALLALLHVAQLGNAV